MAADTGGNDAIDETKGWDSMGLEPSESERYGQLSRQYIERADEYLRAGDRVQASEKGWGAVAEAVKSIAAKRGWNHQGHRLLNQSQGDTRSSLSLGEG